MVMDEIQQLKAAIEIQENLRGSVDDAIIDATIATLREKLTALESDSFPPQQRKLVTLLYADIVSSTRIVKHLDPEDALEIIDGALKRRSCRSTMHAVIY